MEERADMIIQHNMQSIGVNGNLKKIGVNIGKKAERLSSGYRINRAADDAAGLAISEEMRGQIRGLNRGSLNSQDGISFIRTAEGALSEVHNIIQRCRELSVQAANDTNVEADRKAIQDEIDVLNDEIDSIAKNAEFNTQSIFDASMVNTPQVVPGSAGNIISLDGDFMAYSMQDFTSAINQAAAAGKTFTQAGLDAFANALKSTYMPKLLGDITSSLPSATPTVAGMKIGLKMYYDDNNTLAYVGSNGTSYQLGVNLKYLTETAGSIGMSDDLATTIAHEMTHAVMFDEVTNGMLGVNGADAFPSWFVEGTAQAVGGAINYCPNLGSMSDAQLSNWLADLTDTSDSYNAYAQGYIGSMYLGYIAGGAGAVDAATIRTGIDNILRDISDGYSLSEAIYRKTNHQYADLLDFETKFSTDAVQFTKDLVAAIGAGTGSIVSPAGLSGTKASLLTGSATSNFFELDTDNEMANNSGIINAAGKDPYNGGGATTTGGKDRNGNINPNASPKWGSSSGQNILTKAGGFVYVQVGANSNQGVEINKWKLSTKDLGIANAKVTSNKDAENAIEKYDKALNAVSDMRAYYGAMENRLEHCVSNDDNMSENLQSAESKIRDTDIAKEMVDYSAQNIIQQAGQSLLAQANQATRGILTLLG